MSHVPMIVMIVSVLMLLGRSPPPRDIPRVDENAKHSSVAILTP